MRRCPPSGHLPWGRGLTGKAAASPFGPPAVEARRARFDGNAQRYPPSGE
ncbi:MAG: hypothetical protein LBK61_12475 [Spirochaetaceae bacterium]|nr:hypothetical protein [Spirochaetaceae bacterium]